MLHRRDGARNPSDVTLGIQAKEFNLGFIRTENLVSHCLIVFRCLLANSKRAVMCLLQRSGISLECCRDGCRSGSLSHLHRGTLELCQSDHRVLGHLPDQGHPPPIAQFCRAASSRKSLGGSKLLVDLQCCRHFLVPFPRSVPRHNHVAELYRQFL